MEQHYIVVFGIAGESIGEAYTATIIISKYPGDPLNLLWEIYNTIEKDSVKNFNKLIRADTIGLKSLTLIYQK